MTVISPVTRTSAHRPPRLGFLGAGGIGRARLAALLDRMDLAEVAICDISEAACNEARRRAPGAAICCSEAELLDRELDGVVIATPNMLHESQCLRAIERGLAVFCQKPLAPTVTETRRVVDAAREHDVPLAVDWSYRHLRGLRQVRERLDGGAIGSLLGIDLVFHNAWGPDGAWFYQRRLSGGGCLIDLGVHLIDLAMWLLDGTAISCTCATVSAQGQPLEAGADADDAPVEDFAWAQLGTEDGPPVRIACSWRAHVGSNCRIECHVHGSEGGLSVQNIDGSFFDFQTFEHTGTTSRLIATDDASWGGGALAEWTAGVQRRERFDPEAERAVVVATVIESIYERAFSCTCS